MRKLMIHVVDAAKVHVIIGQFMAPAALQGATLVFMTPFLRAPYIRSKSLTGWLVAVVTLGVATFVIGAIVMFRSYGVSALEVYDTMIDRVAEYVSTLPFGWFNTKREAATINAISKGVNILPYLCSMVIPGLCDAFIVPLMMLMTIGIVEWPLAPIMAVAIVPLYLVWWMMCLTTTRANEAENQAVIVATGRLVGFACLQPVLRATRVSRKGWRPVQKILEADSKATLDGLRIKGRPGQFFTLVPNTTFVMVLALELSFVSGCRLDVAIYLAIIIMVAWTLLPLTKGALYASETDDAVIAFKAIVSILDAEPLPGPSPEQIEEPKGTDIVLHDVSFSYKGGWPVLDGVSLTAKQGKVTVLVGLPGANKSTVLRLATRFQDVTAGTVDIDNVDVRHLPTAEIVVVASMVFQEVYLLSTTTHENLWIARPDATDEKLGETTRHAGLDRTIEVLLHGWDTPVDPGGVSLSGGERQRVSIARAFLKDVPIPLLDEAAPAPNGESESAITEVIRELSRGRTALVVTYRLSTIRQADQVVFLEPSPDDARVAQAGTMPKPTAQEGPFRGFVEVYTVAPRW